MWLCSNTENTNIIDITCRLLPGYLGQFEKIPKIFPTNLLVFRNYKILLIFLIINLNLEFATPHNVASAIQEY
jgi:hypothetical protein